VLIETIETDDGNVELHSEASGWRHYLLRPATTDYYVRNESKWLHLYRIPRVSDVYMTVPPQDPKVWKSVPLF
jgi:hypothetical protein